MSCLKITYLHIFLGCYIFKSPTLISQYEFMTHQLMDKHVHLVDVVYVLPIQLYPGFLIVQIISMPTLYMLFL